ncbi:RidA family protein [Natronorarus salvus]|uniref:RidA family protein n=1 Tax=Natronorarus salvus TaxID=3117733 RepID=UPI002F26BA12
MEKSLISSEFGDEVDHDVAFSDAVAVEMDSHTRVYISGIVAHGETVEAQTRGCLEGIESIVKTFDGSFEDVVRVRLYVSEPLLDDENLETIHEVRQEFFESQYPASTLVETSALVSDDFLIEIDADAIVPDEGWEPRQVDRRGRS